MLTPGSDWLKARPRGPEALTEPPEYKTGSVEFVFCCCSFFVFFFFFFVVVSNPPDAAGVFLFLPRREPLFCFKSSS
jgi:hypothetical protein